LGACAHEEGVFAGLEIFVEGDFVHSDADVFGGAGNFLVFFHAGFAAADAAERTHLKFAAVAFFLESYQRVVGGARAIRNIQVKNRAAILHMIFRGGAFENCVPVLAANAVGGEAGGASAGFGARDGGALDEDEGGAVFPIDADLGRWKIRVECDGSGGGDYGRRWGSGIDHHFDDGVGDIGGFEGFEAVDGGVEFGGVGAGGAADFGDDDVVGEVEAGHFDDVLIGETLGSVLGEGWACDECD